MNKGVTYTLIGLAALLILSKAKKIATWYNLLEKYFTDWEGFSATPYWDYKQWSWGYGTRVPGSVNDPKINPGGVTNRVQALVDAIAHAENDYSYLQGLIKRKLTARQWAALLSFSYNLGPGNADNLVANINAGLWNELQAQWLKYNMAGGKFNQHLADRREFEINEFLKDIG